MKEAPRSTKLLFLSAASTSTDTPGPAWTDWMPGIDRARSYKKAWLARDVIAGLVLVAFLVPVGMAYAQASGLPPVNGLYATVVPLLAYALFGPSRRLVLGPDSSLAPLIALTILPLADGDPTRAVAFGAALAIGSGLVCILGGTAGLGFLTELLSVPVRVGYLNGIAVVVIINQFPSLLGVDVESPSSLGRLRDVAVAMSDGEISGAATTIGLGSLVILVGIRRLTKVIPAVLVVVLLSMLAVWIFDLEDQLSIVGVLPQGVPSFGVPSVSRADLGALAVGSLTIALLSFADTTLLSRAYADIEGQRVDANRELVALGVANLSTGFFQGFPISASSSRTPVARTAGSKSQLTGVVAAMLIVAFLVWFPSSLRTLPTATLAAVVIVAVLGLIDVPILVHLFGSRRKEFWLSVASFLGVVVLGVLWGVGFAVGLSLVVFIQRAWRPYTTELVRVDGLKGYHDSDRHPDGNEIPGLLLYRFDAPLFFANADVFHEEVLERVRRNGQTIRWVVISAGPITDIDSTADDVLIDLHERLTEMGVTLAFAELRGVVRDSLERSGTAALIGEDRFFPTTGRSVSAYVEETGVGWVDWQDEEEPPTQST